MKKDNDENKTPAPTAWRLSPRPRPGSGLPAPKPAVQPRPHRRPPLQRPAAKTPKPVDGAAAHCPVAPVDVAYEPSLPDDPVYTGALVHGRQVEHLAAALFRELAPLHKLDAPWDERLRAAARLHDIGWVEAGKSTIKPACGLLKRIRPGAG